MMVPQAVGKRPRKASAAPRTPARYFASSLPAYAGCDDLAVICPPGDL